MTSGRGRDPGLCAHLTSRIKGACWSSSKANFIAAQGNKKKNTFYKRSWISKGDSDIFQIGTHFHESFIWFHLQRIRTCEHFEINVSQSENVFTKWQTMGSVTAGKRKRCVHLGVIVARLQDQRVCKRGLQWPKGPAVLHVCCRCGPHLTTSVDRWVGDLPRSNVGQTKLSMWSSNTETSLFYYFSLYFIIFLFILLFLTEAPWSSWEASQKRPTLFFVFFSLQSSVHSRCWKRPSEIQVLIDTQMLQTCWSLQDFDWDLVTVEAAGVLEMITMHHPAGSICQKMVHCGREGMDVVRTDARHCCISCCICTSLSHLAAPLSASTLFPPFQRLYVEPVSC